MKHLIALDDRELATVLAGLRYWQKMVPEAKSGFSSHYMRRAVFPEHFRDVEPLLDAEIDALCERINCSEITGAVDELLKHYMGSGFGVGEQIDALRVAIFGEEEEVE